MHSGGRQIYKLKFEFGLNFLKHVLSKGQNPFIPTKFFSPGLYAPDQTMCCMTNG